MTPLQDGMNLVAKEYVTVQQATEGDGVLVLSEFAGAVEELPEALPCNPFDLEGWPERSASRSSSTRTIAAAGLSGWPPRSTGTMSLPGSTTSCEPAVARNQRGGAEGSR